MLSGFLGLMAIDTSAGFVAEGSVMRTICCAEVTGANKHRAIARVIHGLMLD
jgi:hypothetical protein